MVSTDPLTIETYDDLFNLDAEVLVYGSTWWPNYTYGPLAWHTNAIGVQAEADKKLAFSTDKATANNIEWMSYVAGPSLEILKGYVDASLTEPYIPYAPTLGEYVTAEEAAARYANLAAWYEERGNFWVGTGPFYLYRVFPVEQTVTLQRNPDFPDMADKWSGFGEPKIATVELDGPGQVATGTEAVFDVFVTFKDEPYPADEVASVKYLVFDANGNLVTRATQHLWQRASTRLPWALTSLVKWLPAATSWKWRWSSTRSACPALPAWSSSSHKVFYQ